MMRDQSDHRSWGERIHSFREQPGRDPHRGRDDYDEGGWVRHSEPDWRMRLRHEDQGARPAQGLYGNFGPRAFRDGMGGGIGAFGGGMSAWTSEQRRSYEGRGPRNYVRSDARVREDVCEALADNRDVDASDIEVMVADGIVRLEGSVASRPEKWVAEDCAFRISGVRDVENWLRVKSQEWVNRAW